MEVSGLVGVSPLFVLGNGKGERGVEHGVHHVNEWHVGNYGAEQVRTHVDDCAHRSEEHTSELQSSCKLVCRLLLEKKKHDRATSQGQEKESGGGRVHPAFNRQCHKLLDVYERFFFFFNDTATTEIYTLSLHDALPI